METKGIINVLKIQMRSFGFQSRYSLFKPTYINWQKGMNGNCSLDEYLIN